jgi:Zn-dependent M28 family amino/carboxypeptidase
MQTRRLWVISQTVMVISAVGLIAAWAEQRPAATAPDAKVQEIVRAITAADTKRIDDKLVSFGTRSGLSEPVSTESRGAVPARQWIASEFQAISAATGGRLKVSVDTFNVPKGGRIPADQTMSNVVAILPGTDPADNRIFVVSGHYDSIPGDFAQDAPGANDDASGTVVSIECARALAKYQFPATIEFLAVEGEEQGLVGSGHAAKTAKAAGQNIAAMLNNDIVGGDQTPGHENQFKLRVFSPGISANMTPQQIAEIASNGWENDSPAREVARYAATIAEKDLPGFGVVLEYREDRFQRGGDNRSFENEGFPAVRFSEFNENSNHQHQPVHVDANGVEIGDLPKWVSPEYMANVARVNALTLASLASSPIPPEKVTFRAGQQIGNVITWTPVKSATSYVLLYRETAANQWSERPAPANPAPPSTTNSGPMFQIDIPESGDNYIFAVAAVDAQGHQSLPRLAVAAGAGQRRGAPGGGAF